MPATFAIVTFGCRVNQADSLQTEEGLRAAGLVPSDPEKADIVIVNTCSVTAAADQGTRQTIRRIARHNAGARIVVTGCYATRRPDEIAVLPGVVRVVSNEAKDGLASWLAHESGLTTAERFGEGDGGCGAALRPGVAGRTAYTLRVQTGCEERCSYCIIPQTRGRARSVAPARVFEEVRSAVAAGFKEIALTGVHLGSYGRDLTPVSSLADLLRGVIEIDADVRFRISSLEPMDCTPEIVDLAAETPRIAAHFHLPLQHASDAVLERMARPYRLADYERLVDAIRQRLPDAAVGSDIIVGFPGETDDQARLNESYLLRSPLTSLHVFPYSDRPGTTATMMEPKVQGALVKERGQRVRSVGAELSRRFRTSQIGRVRPALTLDDGTTAVTDNYLKVRIPPGCSRNEWIDVRISEGDGELRGTIVANR